MAKTYTNTELKILEACKLLIANSSYSEVSMRKIAEQAGVNEVTLYRIFCSKKRLFNATIGYILQLAAFDTNGVSSKSLEESLFSMGNAIMRFMIDNVSLIKIQTNLLDVKMLKKFGDKIFSDQLNFLKTQFMTYKNLSEASAVIEASCFLSSFRGLFMNIYIFERLPKDIPLEIYVNNIVSKYK